MSEKEHPLVEGRLADIIEMDSGADVMIGEYTLSDHDRKVVVDALRWVAADKIAGMFFGSPSIAYLLDFYKALEVSEKLTLKGKHTGNDFTLYGDELKQLREEIGACLVPLKH
jgi:hypothetical protein